MKRLKRNKIGVGDSSATGSSVIASPAADTTAAARHENPLAVGIIPPDDPNVMLQPKRLLASAREPHDQQHTPTTARPLAPDGISAHFLHQWVVDTEKGFEAGRRRLSQWSADQAFVDPATGKLAATPVYNPGTGWSVSVQLPSGRRSFIALTRDGEIIPGTSAHLPAYALGMEEQERGRALSQAERQTVFDSWLPGYRESTRMVWDETVDPVMYVGGGWELRPDIGQCTNFIEVLQHRSPKLQKHFGPADAMVSHALENSFASLDRAVQLYVAKKGLDPREFRVWMDGA